MKCHLITEFAAFLESVYSSHPNLFDIYHSSTTDIALKVPQSTIDAIAVASPSSPPLHPPNCVLRWLLHPQVQGVDSEGVDRSRRAFLDLPGPQAARTHPLGILHVHPIPSPCHAEAHGRLPTGRNRNASIVFDFLQRAVGPEVITQWKLSEEHARYSLYCEEMSHHPDVPKVCVCTHVWSMRVVR